jgi:hypothetical protein
VAKEQHLIMKSKKRRKRFTNFDKRLLARRTKSCPSKRESM